MKTEKKYLVKKVTTHSDIKNAGKTYILDRNDYLFNDGTIAVRAIMRPLGRK